MRFVFFVHSLASDWNHGNAHFVRGVLSELRRRGHDVAAFEPEDAWSRQNLVRDHGQGAADAYHDAYPDLCSTRYDDATADDPDAVRALAAGADVLVVHEWTDPAVVAALGRADVPVRLFHDTHHRCVTAPEEMSRFDLGGYHGVLAFGGVIRAWYARHHDRPAFTWHEAADPHVFHPKGIHAEGTTVGSAGPGAEALDLIWVGNWGDDERTAELHEFLIGPVKRLGLSATVHGVRYPDAALDALADAGIAYGGYLPNHRVPDAFGRHRLTVHVPRGPYTRSLPGIPTIRPFEALACGIPLASAPWSDAEHLFRPGDLARVGSGAEMQATLEALLGDAGARRDLAARGRETVLARHTCAHRVDELLTILDDLA
ncbi:CgeB family protein [Phycisphaera mikurensis]|uniref:Spore protein YkvP/CgeB glycosyl transferase-like domain-containing protein n=1 Tax=Phycisphaera mikurensis (strain NBRC 102666 / KCTC 22515 / FYK2301M01) TaxID=1142394 RepID=I0IA79_PHYMF|nr:glycosyltransferase [Phycisphaera mikurensis]MBB6441831.1 spore maturation protein CgeB [Phycisphaera mikurensis]BAM02167.1 hypothetical protein PSMK_00080 [Phycisphaera mikurensis NBRC 102666]